MIIPPVSKGGEKLARQVAVGSMHLQAIKSGLAYPVGGLAEGVYEMLYSCLCHLAG